jgi:hypothetical protein
VKRGKRVITEPGTGFLQETELGDLRSTPLIVRYKHLDHVVCDVINSINMQTGETGYSKEIFQTACGHTISYSRRKPRPGMPTCVRCLGTRRA